MGIFNWLFGKNPKKTEFKKVSNFLVSAGKDFNGINLGDNKKSIDDFLNDKGIVGRKYDDSYYVEYLNYGLQIGFDFNNKMMVFYLYNDAEKYEHIKKFPVKTSKNIDWNSNISDIISAYGNTKKQFSDTSEIVKWDRLEYDGIDFRFENDKLVRIGIFEKEKTTSESKPKKKKAVSKSEPNEVFASDSGFSYSKDDLFLVLCFGGIVAHSSGRIEKLGNIYKWFDKNEYGRGLGLNKEQIQIIHNKLSDGDDAALEIAKKLSLEDQGDLIFLIYQLLEINEDQTLETVGALISVAILINPYLSKSLIEYISRNLNFTEEVIVEAVIKTKLQFLHKSDID